jgi:hypothetical protein
VVQDDDVARLLAAEGGARHLHALEDVLVADRRADDLTAGSLDRPLQAAVREDRHDETARQRPVREPLEGEDPEHLVAVDHPTAAIHRDEAVGVTVEREPDVGAPLGDRGSERCRRGGPALDVDVDPVGLDVDGLDPCARGLQDAGSHDAARAVRPVQHDMESGRVDRARQPDPMLQVRLDGPGRVHRPPELRIADAAELALAPDQRLELLLDRVVELEAVGIEHLEAVVVRRVVRGRDHDPGLVRTAPRQEGECRGRDDADHVHVDTETRGARGDRRDEHVTRAARVLAHDDAPARSGHPLRRRPAQRVGHRRFEVDIRDTADPVGAEQT